MAKVRVWAQEWRNTKGQAVYSVHRYQQDIVQFGRLHNQSQYSHNLITQHHRAWETTISESDAQKIDDHGYGLIVRSRPR